MDPNQSLLALIHTIYIQNLISFECISQNNPVSKPANYCHDTGNYQALHCSIHAQDKWFSIAISAGFIHSVDNIHPLNRGSRLYDQ